MPWPVIAAALARAAPALLNAGASAAEGAALTKAGSTAAEVMTKKGGMDMSLLSNPAAYVQGGPSPGNPNAGKAPGNPFAGMDAPVGKVGSAFEQLSGKLPLISEGIGKWANQLMEGIDRLRQWTDGLHQSNMQFAEFSASMSAVQAQAEVREFQLNREKGDRRAQSAGFLAEQKGGLDKSLAPIENLWAKIENVLGGSLLFLLDKLLTPVTVIAEWLDSSTSGDAGGDTIGADEWMARLGQMEKDAVARRPGRLR